MVVLLLLVQSTVMVDLTVGGAHPSILLLLPIAAGIVGGPEEGAVMGFVAGMAADLLLPTPFGLSALVGSLIGFAVGLQHRRHHPRGVVVPGPGRAGGQRGGVMLYAVLGAVLGQGQFLEVDLVAVVAVVAVVNAALAGPAVRLVAWAFGESATERPRPRVAGGRW